MFAYTAVTPNNLTTENADIPLKFSPLVTILEVEVNGPKTGTSVKVTNVNVTSSDGTALAGNFECLISDRSGTCKPVDDGTVTNRVSVSCYNGDDFIELGTGDKMIVKFFLLPETGTDIAKGSLKVTVSTLNGAAKTKTLQTADVLSQRVNRVSLPALVANDDTNYWMSNLDKDIYFSELSIPGSFMAAGTTDNSNYLRYQNKSLATQFEDGIRFFNFQTDWQQRIFYAGQSHNDVTVDKVYNDLKTALDNAKTYLDSKNRECLDFVVIQFNYKSIGWEPGAPVIDYEAKVRKTWIRELSTKINTWAEQTDAVVNPSANMTLGDLGGKIVFIIRYIEGDMTDEMSGKGDISSVYLNWPGEEKKLREIGIQYGNPNNAAGELKFIHQDISDVTALDGSYSDSYDPGDGNTYTRSTPGEKWDIVTQLFDRGVSDYVSNNSLTEPMKNWYYNNLGGFCRVRSSGVGGNTIDHTNFMHPRAVDYLQARTQNASLGLVMMNFADKQGDSGALYKSDWLIQTIIDNNFKFALRKKPSGSTTAASYNASYKTGGNAVGWDE